MLESIQILEIPSCDSVKKSLFFFLENHGKSRFSGWKIPSRDPGNNPLTNPGRGLVSKKQREKSKQSKIERNFQFFDLNIYMMLLVCFLTGKSVGFERVSVLVECLKRCQVRFIPAETTATLIFLWPIKESLRARRVKRIFETSLYIFKTCWFSFSHSVKLIHI